VNIGRLKFALVFMALIALAVMPARWAAGDDTVLNPDTATYDSHPSAASLADGTTWIAWHAYDAGRDRVLVRRVASDGNLGPTLEASSHGAAHGPPTVLALSADSVWVVWSARVSGRWQVVARHWESGKWDAAVTLSRKQNDAIQPTAVHTHSGTVIVAWTEYQQGRFRIIRRQFDDDGWSESLAISSKPTDAFRPVLTADHTGDAWAIWDHYDGQRYGVVGRRIEPTLGRIEQISPRGKHCLTPTALATRQGLCVAWLQKDDVIGGPRVISQWHTLHAAIRNSDGRWRTIRDEHDKSAAAELTQGLVAKIAPRAVATGGYLGRRTAPMLVEDEDDVWLLWERKTDHRGSTPNVVGDLLGRPIRKGRWQSTALIHTGRLDYHLPHGGRVADNQLVVLASQLPRNNRRIYHRLSATLAETQPFQQDAWPGWRPVELPIKAELTERRDIQIGNKKLKLYWADLHCHTTLTCDAEGEHDELTHYARDRAQLDVVAMTNNDFLYDAPLTEYEYQLSAFFAQVYSKPGAFLTLPGYEWTSRVPGVRTAKFSDRGNWTAPYRNRSYPNHRTVIYPPSGGPIVRFPEVANDIDALNTVVEKAGGITLTQHDAFLPSGHKVEVGMELTSGWRNYIARVPNLFHGPLNRGTRLGFVANGDTHRRAPGLSGALTGIYAEELTAASILDALRRRRCFATNGSRIFLDARANGSFMGEDVTTNDRVTLSLQAIGTRPLVSATLVCDGKEIRTLKANGEHEVNFEVQESGLTPGVHWYYWRIAQARAAADLPGNLMAAHGHLAWSTPHWVIAK